MMKHNIAIATGLASLFVLPTALGQENVEKLGQALNEISHALDVMSGIEQRLAQEPEQGIDLVLGATEAPHLEQRALDERLVSLRKEVSLLQMEFDALESPSAIMTLQPFVPGVPHGAGEVAQHTRESRPTAGLDDALRAAISTRQPAPTRPRSEPGLGESQVDTTSDEFDGYSADPLGQARACYRVGRYKQGLDLLGQLDDAAALYWRARCLERLDRIDEAAALLERVVQDEADSYEGQRAAKDLEFLEWKKQFLEKLPTGMKAKERQG